jgi:hypothetical protein
MFNKATGAEPAPDVEAPSEELIPVSHLALDLREVNPGYLNAHGIEVVDDGIGRPSIHRHDARRLLIEQRENEVRMAEHRAAAEKAAVEADQQRRAQLWGGIPSDYLPPGVAPAAVMLQAVRDTQPKRMSPLQEALAGESLTFHSFAPTPEEAE